MRNQHLRQLLNELPRYQASDGFVDAVTTRIHETGRRRGDARTWTTALVSAAATIAITLGATHLALEHRKQSRIDVLETQRRELQREVAAIRDQTRFDTVIDIGQEDGVHYILDLRPLERPAEQTAALKPVFD